MAEETRSDQNRKKHEMWGSHVEAWKESGLSQINYCREHNLSRHQFTYWKCKHEKKNNSVTFIPISGNSVLSQNQTSIRLAFGGYTIEIGDGFRPETLSALIRTLRSV